MTLATIEVCKGKVSVAAFCPRTTPPPPLSAF